MQLSGTRDKRPLDIPAHLCDSVVAVLGGKYVVSSLHAHSVLFQVYSPFRVCAPEYVCVLHTLLQPAVDVDHFLACVSVLVYQHPCWLFPCKCVCVDRGHFLSNVCCVRLLSEECQAGSTPPGEDDVIANGFLFCEPVEWSNSGQLSLLHLAWAHLWPALTGNLVQFYISLTSEIVEF